MLKIPYAVRDFEKLITEGFTYLDRTDRIPQIEEAGFELLFLRPRRFGKSLLISMLMNYYDLAKADQFERLFGHLVIGKNPTPLHNQYLVMQWDFSYIKSHGSIAEIEKALHEHINEWLAIFANTYAHLLTAEIRIHPTNALASFSSAVAAVQHSGHKLYLFIDEYDNFANEVMTGSQGANQQRYFDLVSGEGMFKTLFKNIKGAGAGKGLDRVFMTGVSPIVMSDITSGSNVTKDVTWRPYFNDLCGFRQEEVQALVEQVVIGRGLPVEKIAEALELMKLFYNGSCFVLREVGVTAKVYNPTLTFYFLDELQEFGLYPQEMLDVNLAPDYHKLVYISSHPKGEQLLVDALREETVLSVAKLGSRFGVKEMLEPDKQQQLLAALLCYLGGLTVGGQTSDGKWILEIPNLVMRKLYAERILEFTFPKSADRDDIQAAADALFGRGELQPLTSFVETHYFPVYHNRDYQHFNELTLKTLFLVLLHANELYIMDSEPTIQRRHGDLIMLIRPEMRHLTIYDILIEFKYLPLAKVTEEKRALTPAAVQQKSPAELSVLPAVQQAFVAAHSQLQDYRQKLVGKYGDALKLRAYAVVAIGFEKVLWQESQATL